MNNSKEQKEFQTSLTQVFSSIPHFFGIRSEEQPEYNVFTREKNFEVRQYSSFVIAETTVVGENYEECLATGFTRLANYIFGKNTTETRMSPNMGHSQRMAMTTPVLQEKKFLGWKMAFILPSYYDLSSAPQPLDERVSVREVPARTVAAVKYSGHTDPAKIDLKTAELTEWILSKDYQIVSSSISAQYDPPSTLPFMRKNEVLIDVLADQYH